MTKYDAFISYRHSDLDSYIATLIQKRLENFKLPKSAVKKAGGKKKISRIFRDQSELTMDDNLGDSISEAISNSDYLIVICTPRYLESVWCRKEIESFLTTHGREDVLLVLAEGEPADSFPEIMTYREVTKVLENGETVIEREEREPLAADIRGSSKREINKKAEDVILRLAASICGLQYDDLKQRHKEQKTRRIIGWCMAGLAIMAAFLIVSLTLLMKISSQNETISEQYRDISLRYADSMASTSSELLSRGRFMDAVYAVRKVLPDSREENTSGDTPLPYSATAYKALSDALQTYSTGSSYSPSGLYEISEPVSLYADAPDGSRILLLGESGTATVFDVNDGHISDSFNCPIDTYDFYLLDFIDSDNIIYTCADGIIKHSVSTGTDTPLYSGTVTNLALIPSSRLLFFMSDRAFITLDTDGNTVNYIDCTEYFSEESVSSYDTDYQSTPVSMYVSKDGAFAALCATRDGEQTVFTGSVSSPSIAFSLPISSSSQGDIILHGDYVYLLIYSNYNTANSLCRAFAINTVSGEAEWAAQLTNTLIENISYIEDINGDYLLLTSNQDFVTLDPANGYVLTDYRQSEYIIETFPLKEKELYAAVTYSGSILSISNGGLAIMDYTTTFYASDHRNELTLDSASFSPGSFICCFTGQNYATRYTLCSDHRTDIDEDAGTQYVPTPDNTGIDNFMSRFDGLNDSDLITGRFLSDDRRFLVVQYADYSLEIYDLGTDTLVNTLYNHKSEYIGMTYLPDIDIYILRSQIFQNSAILDSGFELIAQIRGYLEYSSEKKAFKVSTQNDTTAWLPYVSYDELIRTADEILGDYSPSTGICKQYNINSEDN